MKNILDKVNYICSECAGKYGGVWPKNHLATFHIGKCDICKREKGLANVGDWNWPDRISRGMRD
jgi:hypothetical protein